MGSGTTRLGGLLGAAAIFATAYLVGSPEVFPKWAAALGVLGVPAVLHVWIGLPAAYTTIAWMGLMGVVMLILPPVVRVTSEAAK